MGSPSSRMRPLAPECALDLAYLETGKPGDTDTRVTEHLLHGLLLVLHARLVQQHDLLVEPTDPTVDDLGQRSLWLALLARRRLGNPTLVVDHVCRDVVSADVLGSHRADLHGRSASNVGVCSRVSNQDTPRRR